VVVRRQKWVSSEAVADEVHHEALERRLLRVEEAVGQEEDVRDGVAKVLTRAIHELRLDGRGPGWLADGGRALPGRCAEEIHRDGGGARRHELGSIACPARSRRGPYRSTRTAASRTGVPVVGSGVNTVVQSVISPITSSENRQYTAKRTLRESWRPTRGSGVSTNPCSVSWTWIRSPSRQGLGNVELVCVTSTSSRKLFSDGVGAGAGSSVISPVAVSTVTPWLEGAPRKRGVKTTDVMSEPGGRAVRTYWPMAGSSSTTTIESPNPGQSGRSRMRCRSKSKPGSQSIRVSATDVCSSPPEPARHLEVTAQPLSLRYVCASLRKYRGGGGVSSAQRGTWPLALPLRDGDDGRRSLVLHEEHDEFRRTGIARILRHRVHVIG
jgi:hypothetical protein